MGNEFVGCSAHSAEYFGDTREHWYSPDFLRLLAERWRLDEVREVLDVGSGMGHWGRILGRLLPESACIVGLERDPFWVERATARTRALGLDTRFRYMQGLADALPFADDSFDLVTCQTVLIHLRDPRAAIAEMIRVTRPGGLVAVAEPNNLASALLSDASILRAPVEDIVCRVRFQLLCERGKEALGLGNNSASEAIPGLFAALGLEELKVVLNDKANALLPPYDTPEARAQVEEMRSFMDRDFWYWSRDETRRYFLAGGGDEQDFETCWVMMTAQGRREVEAITRGTYVRAGGSILYLISGRKRR